MWSIPITSMAIASKRAGHKDAVWVRSVISKRRTIHETEFAVEVVSGFEILHGSCFKAQSLIGPAVGFRDDCFQNQTGNAFPEIVRGGAHGLDLPMHEVQLLQRTATYQFRSTANAPKGDF